MKKIILFSVLILLILGWFFYWKKISNKTEISPNVLSEKDVQSSPTPTWPDSALLDLDGSLIRASWTIVNPNDVQLYSNLKDKKLSEEIKENNACKNLVSGGFYTKENTHLGLFVSSSEEISRQIENETLNGFLSIDENNKLKIGNEVSNTPRIALQTGPLITMDYEPLTLSINNDQPERRIVAGSTADNKLIFLVFYNEKSDFQGPLLESLPKVLELFEEVTKIKITDAINLDGGTASVFISNYDLLREMALVGSYFCVK